MAVHLGTGARGQHVLELARSLLDAWGGVGGLARSEVEELTRTPGVGHAKASRLVAAFALADRLTSTTAEVITTSADIARLAQSEIGRSRVEEVVVIVLDGSHRVRHVARVAKGGAAGCPFPVREIASLVLRHDGVAFAVAHNHPGGLTEPSPEDLAATHRLRQVAEQVGLRFLDHVVVTPTSWRGLNTSR